MLKLGVAQSDRAFRLGRKGRRFESCHRDQFRSIGSNPCTPTNLKLLPVELALGLRNRVANVRFIPRVPLYGVCSITGNAQGCEPCRCGIEARHTPQT